MRYVRVFKEVLFAVPVILSLRSGKIGPSCLLGHDLVIVNASPGDENDSPI